nr:ribonuclease H-like domain, reverse transcriptase, RNA-dependent DNA polymerase [Tanacetum cinerariifolium]
MAPKRTSTSAAPTMTQAAIRQLIADGIAAALEAQAANMENTNNTNRNPKLAHVARKYSYKEFMSYQPFNFKGIIWYPKASPFDLVAYSDSDYGGASQDRKSTTGGSQFLGRRLFHDNTRSR